MTLKALLPLFLVLAGGSVSAADAPARPAVPVTVGKAVKRDLQTYLEGLGTVQAYNTVTIRPQVDGQLVKLAVREGQTVHAGDLLFQIDPRPYQAAYDQAVAKKAQDQAQLANAKLDLDRYTKLSDKNYIAHQQLDATQAQVNQLEAAVKGDQALIDAARVNLDYCSIRSPIEGRVGIRAIDVGNVVHASDATGLVVITQLQPIHLMFSLAEGSLQNILKAESTTLPVSAISRDGAKHLDDGVLDLVDNQVDQTTGMVRLRATLPNKANLLWPGQFVNARMTLDKLAGVLTIPVEAIQRGTDGRSVFVVKADGTVEQRSIQIGTVSEGVAVVTKGVADGDTVVTSGQYRLETGAKVEIRSTPVTNG
ncbi:MAG TPA: efflux RND transporter periplasmic adaptor subunit [Magnetospirillaceae bacterium]|nr:efflux RND transporter periplasmic adaptor subunit [Magnetospirillaceae bacterium]